MRRGEREADATCGRGKLTTNTSLVFISVSKSRFGVGEMPRVNPSNKKTGSSQRERDERVRPD